MTKSDSRALGYRVVKHLLGLGHFGLLLMPLVVQAEIDFARDIRPVLSRHCWMCHGPATQMSGLRLDNREAVLKGGASGVPAILPGDPARSHLFARIASSEPGERMPPIGVQLTSAEVDLIGRWIEAGAQWPDESVSRRDDAGVTESRHWAFRRLREVSLPQVSDEDWVRTPVDRFVLARLE